MRLLLMMLDRDEEGGLDELLLYRTIQDRQLQTAGWLRCRCSWTGGRLRDDENWVGRNAGRWVGGPRVGSRNGLKQSRDPKRPGIGVQS